MRGVKLIKAGVNMEQAVITKVINASGITPGELVLV
jgi:hypothetical protein